MSASNFGLSIHEENVQVLKHFKKKEIGSLGRFKWFLFEAPNKQHAEDQVNYLKQKQVTIIDETDGSKKTGNLNVMFWGDEEQTIRTLEEKKIERHQKSLAHNNAVAQRFGIALAQQPAGDRERHLQQASSGIFGHKGRSQRRVVVIHEDKDKDDDVQSLHVIEDPKPSRKKSRTSK